MRDKKKKAEGALVAERSGKKIKTMDRSGIDVSITKTTEAIGC